MSAPVPAHGHRFCPLDDALFAAYHEAGHAIAAIFVDPPRPLAWVRIESGEDGCGGMTRYECEGSPLCYGVFAGANHDSRHAESDAVATIAGPLCAMWYTTGRFRHDDVLAEDLRSVLDFCLFDRKDWERVVVISALLYLSVDEEAERWRDLMLERALDLHSMPGYSASVATVAGALVRQRTLGGTEVEALVIAARQEDVNST